MELNYTFKQKFTAGFSYSVTRDPITDVAYPDTDTTTVSTNVNLDRQQYAALTLTAPITVAKWLNVYNNAVFYYIHFDGTLAGTPLQAGQPAFTLSSNGTFTLDKGWGADLNGRYNSKQRVGYFKFQPFGQVGIAVKKEVRSTKGTIKLTATGIFYTMPLRATSLYNNYRQDLYLRRARADALLRLEVWQRQAGCHQPPHRRRRRETPGAVAVASVLTGERDSRASSRLCYEPQIIKKQTSTSRYYEVRLTH